MTAKEYRKLKKNVDLAIIVNRGSAVYILKDIKPYIDEHPDLNYEYVDMVARLTRSYYQIIDPSGPARNDVEGKINDLLSSNDKEIAETRRTIYGLLI